MFRRYCFMAVTFDRVVVSVCVHNSHIKNRSCGWSMLKVIAITMLYLFIPLPYIISIIWPRYVNVFSHNYYYYELQFVFDSCYNINILNQLSHINIYYN